MVIAPTGPGRRSRARFSKALGVLAAVAVVSATLAGCKVQAAPTPTAPIRAAFYYPWFSEGWNQQGQTTFTNYSVTRGAYTVDEPTVQSQIADMQYGGINVGLASWFGRGTITDRHWPAMIQAAAGTGFGWAPYYEPEGISDPSPQQIADDLHYLWSTYKGTSSGSGLLSLTNKGMVVFVYNADDPTQAKGCDTVSRWNQARQLLKTQHSESVYVDLKVFPGYDTCAGTGSINGWHQYGPSTADHDFTKAPGDGSYSISPGYWKSGAAYGAGEFLSRDRARWQASIARMHASGATWELITTYNEWGEGTSVESSSGCRNPALAGAYCDWRSAPGTGSQLIADLHATPPG